MKGAPAVPSRLCQHSWPLRLDSPELGSQDDPTHAGRNTFDCKRLHLGQSPCNAFYATAYRSSIAGPHAGASTAVSDENFRGYRDGYGVGGRCKGGHSAAKQLHRHQCRARCQAALGRHNWRTRARHRDYGANGRAAVFLLARALLTTDRRLLPHVWFARCHCSRNH